VPLSRFPESSPQRALTEAFLDPGARLLVSDGDSSRAQLRLAHEALLTHWSRARDQIAADTRDLELRGRLEVEANEWRVASRREKKGRVRPAGLPLKEARALLARWGNEFPVEIREFIAASRRASWWCRLRLAVTVAGAVVTPPVIALLIWAGVEWRTVRRVEPGIRYVAVPAGCFEMGSPDSETLRNPNEGPVHRVCLESFELSEFEVTQELWHGVMHTNPSYFKGDQRRPVDSVSWGDVQTFIRWMSFFGRQHYRLPSEAEYEYAERAGTTTPYYWGSRLEDACAYENVADLSAKKEAPEATVVNCDDGYAATAPVGSFRPNPWGFYDMDGNVGSWVEDCYVDNYRQAPGDGSAVTAKDCEARVLRGGAATYYDAHILRSAFRAQLKSFAHSSNVGFRIVRISH
jgi:formylglycine-generating enzyme required for sulfatase activity